MSVDVRSLSSYEHVPPTGSSFLPDLTSEESGGSAVADREGELTADQIFNALAASDNSLPSIVGDDATNWIVTGAWEQQAHLDERSDEKKRLVLKSLLKVEHRILIERLPCGGLSTDAMKRTDSLVRDILAGGEMQSDSQSLSMLLLAVKFLRQQYNKAGKHGVAANDATTSDSQQQQQETVEGSLAAPGPPQSTSIDDVLPPDTAAAAALTTDSALAATEEDGTNETQESAEPTADTTHSAVTPAAAAPVVDAVYLDHVHRMMLTLEHELEELLDIESATRQAVNNYLFAWGSTREATCDKWFLDEFVELTNAHLAVQKRLDSLEETMAHLRDHWSTLRKRHRRIRTRIRRSGRRRSKMHLIHLPMIKDLVESYESVRRAHFQLIEFLDDCYNRALATGWKPKSEEDGELVAHLEMIREHRAARPRMRLCRGRLPQDKVLSSSSLSGESDEEEEDALAASSR